MNKLRKFEDVFKLSTLALHFNGSHPQATRNRFKMFRIVYEHIITFLCFVSLLYSIILYDVNNKEYTEVIKNGVMAIVCVTVTFKFTILLRNRDDIQSLIDTINQDYELSEDLSEEEQHIVMKHANMGVDVCKIWLAASIVTGLLFPVKAFVLMAYKYINGEWELVPMFDLNWPFINGIKKNPIIFTCIFAQCLSFDFFSASMYLGFDPLGPIFLVHACGQLDLLSNRFMKLFSQGTTADAKENLKLIHLKLLEIYMYVKKIQDIFVVLYEFNMKTTTFLIPFSTFQFVESLRKKDISLEFASFAISAVFHFYMPCFYGNKLMDMSEKLRQSIYACGWEMERDIEIRKTILFMLTRTTVPLGIKSIFYSICLDTFGEMASQAYGIYNLMNAAWG
uniref:Odorant receptor n=1 Tax=Heliconius melpomene rosina TaxID=171916 RepID=A0A1S5XXN1_HELME|nr:olfactory receptor 30 [Heliconius melpomene rosina]